MATIKMSGALREAMVKNAAMVFDKRIRLVEKEECVTGDEIWNCMFGNYLVHINALPDFFYKNSESINVRHISFKHDEFSRPQYVDIHKRFMFSIPKPIFHSDSNDMNFDGYSYSNWSGVTIDGDHARWKSVVDKLIAWAEKRDSLLKEQREYKNIVCKIVDAFNTLAPMIKEYPAMWDLVPQEYKDRHLTVTEKRKKTKVELDVDVNKINAITARAKLTGGL